MGNLTLLSAAEVLEKAAAYIEAVEAERQAAVSAEQAKVASDLRTKISTITGESPSDEVLAKLASSEPAVVALIEKLAGTLQAPESLGGPGEESSPDAPRTKTASVQAADDQFVTWLSN
jgi:hypothetical protein